MYGFQWIVGDSGFVKVKLSRQDIGYELYKNNLLEFNTKTGQYVANQKLRELLEHLAGDNQQPSLNSNVLEGSETSSES